MLTLIHSLGLTFIEGRLYSICTGYDKLELSLLESSDVGVPFFSSCFQKRLEARVDTHGMVVH